MLSAFFVHSSRRTRVVAWSGLVVVVAYAAFVAWVKAQINDFYSTFYDLLGDSPDAPSSGLGDSPDAASSGLGDSPDAPHATHAIHGSSASPDDEAASGDALDPWGARRAAVWDQLLLFAEIVAPLVLLSPVAKWVRSAWAFEWRSCLMRTYLDSWDVSGDPIEGASQRLHEDTARFCGALQGCLATVLDALFTLLVFGPVLIELSGEVKAPGPLVVFQPLWLLGTATLAAVLGLGGAMLVGQRLVMLEVANQRVEASLRRDLVVLEASPSTICGTHTRGSGVGVLTGRTAAGGTSPTIYFALTLQRLRENYHALFRHFTLLNLWLAAFDQVMVIFPYLLVAPLIFASAPEERITLGTLIKVTNSFDKVFSSLSILSENWGAINDFRSVAIRLREFEANLYRGRPPATTTRRGDGDVVVVDGEPPPSTCTGELPTAPDPPSQQIEMQMSYGHELYDMRV